MCFYSARCNNAMIATWTLPTQFGLKGAVIMLLLLLWELLWLVFHQEIKREAQICCLTDLQR